MGSLPDNHSLQSYQTLHRRSCRVIRSACCLLPWINWRLAECSEPVAAIFAAGMSTISTSFNSMATVFYVDFYKKFTASKNDSKALNVLYGVSIVIGILGVSIALAMINVKGVLDTWWKFASIFSGGMLGLFILGITTTKKGNTIPIIATAFGVVTLLWITLSDYFPEYYFGLALHSYLAIVLSTSTLILVGLLLFRLKAKND